MGKTLKAKAQWQFIEFAICNSTPILPSFFVFAFFSPSLHIIASESRQQGDRNQKVQASKLSQTLNPQTLLLKAMVLEWKWQKTILYKRAGMRWLQLFGNFTPAGFAWVYPSWHPAGVWRNFWYPSHAGAYLYEWWSSKTLPQHPHPVLTCHFWSKVGARTSLVLMI